jgi:hypothetical protein
MQDKGQSATPSEQTYSSLASMLSHRKIKKKKPIVLTLWVLHRAKTSDCYKTLLKT